MSKKEESSENFSNKLFKNFDDNFFRYRYQIFSLLLGIIFVLLGLFIFRNSFFGKNSIEIIDGENEVGEKIIVEIAGEVIKPGVYKLGSESRIEDLLILAGGVSASADRNWMEKTLNRAAKLSDGQKIYIKSVNEQSEILSANVTVGDQSISSNFEGQGSGFVDINNSTQKELESLNGIGPIYAQKIIEYRPYSNVEEIVSKAKIPQKTFEKIKDQIIVY